MTTMTVMGWLRRRRQPQRPPRHWFRDGDGHFYRNCPLIKAEQDAVMQMPRGRFRTRLLDELTTEWFDTFAIGSQRKAELEPGDIETHGATFREAYPRNPGLWVLDRAR